MGIAGNGRLGLWRAAWWAPVCALALYAQAGHAALFEVTKLGDSADGACNADCSLREAIIAANASPGLDRIVLATSTFSLSLPAAREDDTIDEDEGASGDLDIRDDLDIIGSGSTITIIDGGAGDRVLEVLPGVTVTLRSLGIRNGRVSQLGAGIRNDGTLSLEEVRVTGNVASGAFVASGGGGIFNAGTLSLAATVIDGNRVSSGEGGLGWGGGIYNTGLLRIRERTIISNNRGSDDDDNGSGGGLYNRGTAYIVNALFAGNGSSTLGRGGAIVNAPAARLVMSNSTVSGNAAGDLGTGGGAAVYNASGGSGGGMELRYVTIADNPGGGLLNTGAATLIGTIVAGNPDLGGEPNAGVNCRNEGSAFAFTGVSTLIGNDGNCVGDIAVDNADVLGTVLLPLADNGGRTRTHALPATSPAVDASQASCPANDQRSVKRPRDGDGDGTAGCDIGAFER